MTEGIVISLEMLLMNFKNKRMGNRGSKSGIAKQVASGLTNVHLRSIQAQADKCSLAPLGNQTPA